MSSSLCRLILAVLHLSPVLTLVYIHHWPAYPVKSLTWKGALPGSTSLATHAVLCSPHSAITSPPITSSAYVSPDLTD